jgi:hypothetical protein
VVVVGVTGFLVVVVAAAEVGVQARGINRLGEVAGRAAG